MAVFAENAGSSAAWHPHCFLCHKCKELLVDMIYFFSNGNVYCGRHYAELDGHRCSGCDEVSALNRVNQGILASSCFLVSSMLIIDSIVVIKLAPSTVLGSSASCTYNALQLIMHCN